MEKIPTLLTGSIIASPYLCTISIGRKRGKVVCEGDGLVATLLRPGVFSVTLPGAAPLDPITVMASIQLPWQKEKVRVVERECRWHGAYPPLGACDEDCEYAARIVRVLRYFPTVAIDSSSQHIEVTLWERLPLDPKIKRLPKSIEKWWPLSELRTQVTDRPGVDLMLLSRTPPTKVDNPAKMGKHGKRKA